MLRHVLRIIPALLLLLALVAISGPAHAQEHSVTIDDFEFMPSTLTVNVGDTVTWVNKDEGVPHNAHATDDTFQTEVVEGSADGATSGSYTFTVDDVGTHGYICDVHPNMQGTIVVQAADDDGQTDDGDTPVDDGDQTDDGNQGGNDDGANNDGGEPEVPDTGGGAMAPGAGLPFAPIWGALTLLIAGGYTLLRRR